MVWGLSCAGGLRACNKRRERERGLVACRWEGRGGGGVDVRGPGEAGRAKSPLCERERESSAPRGQQAKARFGQETQQGNAHTPLPPLLKSQRERAMSCRSPFLQLGEKCRSY